MSDLTGRGVVIGDPVAHSLSPVIHRAAFAACDLHYGFDALRVPEGEAGVAVERMRTERWLGMSVTMPHKRAVIEALDGLTAGAASLEAVNCVYRDGDHLVGDNTDGEGLVQALRRRHAFDPAGRRVVVIGAGGAARAVVAALAGHGAVEVAVANRTPATGRLAAARRCRRSLRRRRVVCGGTCRHRGGGPGGQRDLGGDGWARDR
ncbi:MAG: hypothetical protein R2698_13525 [Microthrixaceae bacterium]